MNGHYRWNDLGWLMESEKETFRENTTVRKRRGRSHAKVSALEARRAVEDFILMKHYQDLHAEFSEA